MLPIRKIAVAAAAAALIYLASLLGLELSDADAQAAANAFVPILLGYLVPDPRVDTTIPR